MTAPKIFAPEYYTHMAALESASWWNSGMRDLADRLLSAQQLPATGAMLDVGCGSGQTMSWFRSRHPGWKTTGIDVAPEGLAAAAAAGEHVVEASALDLPFPAASFDVIITFDVLQHLPLDGGDRQALREMRRVLRPGGWLVIRTNAQAIPYTADDPAYNFHKYTSTELREKLTNAGFAVHRLGRVNALLGLAEIPRELAARGREGGGYVGLLSTVPPRGLAWHLKRAWLRLEGACLSAGASVPLGRTHLVIARASAGDQTP